MPQLTNPKYNINEYRSEGSISLEGNKSTTQNELVRDRLKCYRYPWI